MNLKDNVRVLVDWNDDGLFSPPGSPGEGEPRNILVDPVRMNSAKHEAINSAWLQYANWMPQADRLDAYEYRVATSTSAAVALHRDGEHDGRQVLTVTMLNATAATSFRIGSYTLGGFLARIPKPSDALETITPAATLDFAAGTYTARCAIRATHENTVGEAVTLQLSNSAGGFIANSGSPTVFTEEFQYVTVNFTLGSPITNATLAFLLTTPAENLQVFEVIDLGFYRETGFTSLANYISQTRTQLGVYPVIEDTAVEDDTFARNYVHVHTGAEVFGGYRCTYPIQSLPALEPLQTYTALVWIKHTGSVTTNTDFVLRAFFRQDDTMHLPLEWTSVAVTVGSGTAWQRLAVTFITPQDLDTLDVGIEVVKNNVATVREVLIAGWMVVQHGESLEASDILFAPTNTDEWVWGNKWSEFGPKPEETSHTFAPVVLRTVEVDSPVLSDRGVTWGEDVAGEDTLPGLGAGAYHLIETFEYIDRAQPDVAGIDHTSPLTYIFATASSNNYSHYKGFHKWARRHIVVIPGSNAPFTGRSDARGRNSLTTLPKLFLLTSLNKFPHPNTSVTVTNNGGASSTKAAGFSGSYFRLDVTTTGAQTVVVGNAGEIPVVAGERYLLSFEAPVAGGYTVDILDQSSNIIKTLTINNLIVTAGTAGIGDMYRVITDFVAGAGDTSVRLRINATLSNERFENFWVIRYTDVSGGGVQGTLPTEWNAGKSYVGLDDITGYVLSVRTRSGKNEFNDPIAFEGTADIELNNDARVFSSSNVNSPFYGVLKENLKVQIQYKDGSGDWLPLWSGWTDEFDVEAGRSKSRKATLKAQQGLFRLQEGEFIPGVYENTTVDDLTSKLLARSGWYVVSDSPGSYVEQAQLGKDSTLRDNSAIFRNIDAGIYPLELVGDKWNREIRLFDALRELLTGENAQLWINRDGSIDLRNREFFINRVSDYDEAVSLDTRVDEADHTYGSELINRVEVKLTAKEEIVDEVVWESQGSIELRKGTTKKPYTKTFELDFRFEEGGPKTITKVYALSEGSTMQVYEVRGTGRKAVFKPLTAANAKKYIKMTVVDLPDGGKNVVFSNTYSKTLYITVVLRGDYIKGGEAETYVFEDIPSIRRVKTVYKKTIDANTITTEAEAESLAQYILLRQANPYEEFPSIRITPRDKAELLTVLEWELGTVLSLSETQTLATGLPHVVQQEEFDIRPGQFQLRFSLAALDLREYATVGETDPAGLYIYL